jgi:hypothetical protein
MITLTYGLTTLELAPDLMWSDEFSWHPVDQAQERSITGALIVQVASRTGGRPITLEAEDERSAWTPRSAVLTLREWAAMPGVTLQLSIRGESRAVVFRHQDGAMDAKPLVPFADPVAADFYLVTLRFMEI